jgi:tetratricopeptide (TPR) repeat protein
MQKAATIALLLALAAPARADRRSAHQANQRAERLYREGEFQRSLEQFQRAWDSFPEPDSLWGMARCQRQLGQDEAALRSYQQYLASDLPPAMRAEVKSAIAELTQKVIDDHPSAPLILEQPVAVAPDLWTPPTPRPPDIPKAPRRAWIYGGIGLAAAGLALVGGGIACGVLAQQAADQLGRASQKGGAFDPSLENRGHLETALEGALLGVGAAALISGVALAAAGSRPVPVTMSAQISGAGVQLRVVF